MATPMEEFPSFPTSHKCPRCGKQQERISQVTNLTEDATPDEWDENERTIICFECGDFSIYTSKNEFIRSMTINDLTGSDIETFDTLMRAIITFKEKQVFAAAQHHNKEV